MATIPAAASLVNVSSRRLLSFSSPISSCLSNKFDSIRSYSSLCSSFPRFSQTLLKDKVLYSEERRGRAVRDGALFPFLFCTLSSTQPDTSEKIVSPPASLDSDEVNGNDDQEKKIKDAANMLDIRVGRIIKAWRHQEADSLYVEEVDVGEAEPRLICSGLVNYIPLDQLLDRRVIVLANLKPRTMRGIKSNGMLMAASDSSHENVELLFPPEGSIPGERIWFGSEDEKENQPIAATPNQIQKKKIWEMVQPYLKTDASCSAMLCGVHEMRTSVGVVTCNSLKNANIS